MRPRTVPAPALAGTKRKERDFEHDDDEETNINVVVRCRGRNDREIQEKNAVVVSTDSVNGKRIELSLGSAAQGIKSYHFDKVFSPAADQVMVFNEVVLPILEKVLRGFNCTIFTYGQTGTGKTYTMTGDLTDQFPPPATAGIIPRVLHTLFGRLNASANPSNGEPAQEFSVKTSFIELYNEELRDLFSADDGTKLRMFDSESERGNTATVVQGMEETFITCASEGIQLLQRGNHKRQVAATKCNDFSSRSHTIFTVTVNRTAEREGDFVVAGKLNLVDLAGSENIQRSGSENKRAAEAGLINKSLLTLGRVINGLVSKSKHIPYRESKLTRLLQDSLGGETKTCIISTLSSAKSNLEETISTLDYAFRAKNIQNKPQSHQILPKMTLLKEYTGEIRRLKSDLNATRQRNGIYLSQETYDEILGESESRRMAIQEQQDKVEILQHNLTNKEGEMTTLMCNMSSLEKDHDATKSTLEDTQSTLKRVERTLRETQTNLDEQLHVGKEQAKAEKHLSQIGQDLISTVRLTTRDLSRLHTKLQRQEQLQSQNREKHSQSQDLVSSSSKAVEDHLKRFGEKQKEIMSVISSQVESFVKCEIQTFEATKAAMHSDSEHLEDASEYQIGKIAESNIELDAVFENARRFPNLIKEKSEEETVDMARAIQQIAQNVKKQVLPLHDELCEAYESLANQLRATFAEIVQGNSEQRIGVNELAQIEESGHNKVTTSSALMAAELQKLIEQEKSAREEEKKAMMEQIRQLLDANTEQQDSRLREMATFPNRLRQVQQEHDASHTTYVAKYGNWSKKSGELEAAVNEHSKQIQPQLKDHFGPLADHLEAIQHVPSFVEEQTVHLITTKMDIFNTEVAKLNEVVDDMEAHHVILQNKNENHVKGLISTIRNNYDRTHKANELCKNRIDAVGAEMAEQLRNLDEASVVLGGEGQVQAVLDQLRSQVDASVYEDYSITGKTPKKVDYSFPDALPQAVSRDEILAQLRQLPPARKESRSSFPEATSPTKQLIFVDSPTTESRMTSVVVQIPHRSSTGTTGLRELDPNTMAPPAMRKIEPQIVVGAEKSPPVKRLKMPGTTELKKPLKKRVLRNGTAGNDVVDRENHAIPTSNPGGGATRGRRRPL